MKNLNRCFRTILCIFGLFLIISGFICVFYKDLNYGWIGIIAGMLLYAFTSPYKVVYICPKCGAEFRNNDKIVLTLYNSRRSLATCPKCKKTNFCREKLLKNK